jgi:hypothetical protein
MTQALAPAQVAAELSIPLRTARTWIARMPGAFRVGRQLRIARLDFERWIQHRKDEMTWAREGAGSSERSWTRPIVPRTIHTEPRTKPLREPAPVASSEARPIRYTEPRTKPRKVTGSE